MRKSARIISVLLRLFHKGQLNMTGLWLQEHINQCERAFRCWCYVHGRGHLQMWKMIIILKGGVVKTLCSLFLLQLLGTTESSISDVQGLHAKLDRKRSVETHNQQVQMTFQERFHSNLDAMRQDVTAFTDSYHAINTQTVDTLGALSKCFFSIKHLWQFINVEL